MDTICGFELDKFREAYFEGKLKKFLNTVMAKEDVTEKDAEKIGAYLSTLEEKEKTIIDKIQDVFGGHIIEIKEEKLPSVEELQGEIKDMSEEWREKHAKAESWLNSQYQIIQKIQNGAPPPKNFWGDLSMNIIIMQSTLDNIRVYFDQQFHARIIKMVDEVGCSRKEAEDRAKLTPQYRDYKTSLLLKDRLENLIVNTRKNEGYQNQR